MKTLLAIVFSLVTLIASAQSIWVVDNRPTAPTGAHIFASIDAAIAAASPGDIIHVIPSSVEYAATTISKDSLTIYGIGFDPDKDQPNLSLVNSITFGANVSGIRISGLVITNTGVSVGFENTNSSLGNIIIENCDIKGGINGGGDNCCGNKVISNLVIRNCIIGLGYGSGNDLIDLRGTYISSTSNVITNNIIMGTSSTSGNGYPSINVQDAIIKNNIFLGNGPNDYAFSVNTSTISNNIFYGRTALNNPTIGGTGVFNSTFNNNITFGSLDDALPIGINGNTGDSTLVRQDPMFVNLPLVDDWDFSYDPSVMPGSPAEAPAGNDGTEIGIFGSTIPFKLTGSPLPVIRVLRIPEVIKQGDNLDATIEAIGN